MKVFNIIIYYIIFFILNESNQTHIVFNFTKSTKESQNYPDNLIQNDLEITLEIGTPPQKINLNLRSEIYHFSVTSSEVNLPYPTFNETNSMSLIKIKNKTVNWKEEFEEGYPIYESLIINKREIKNVSLVLATSISSNQTGVLGLRPLKSYHPSGYLSFIYQIKRLANLDNYAFTLRYDSDNKGELIIGSYPHLYDKKYDENNFYYTKIGNIGENVEWVFDFDTIKYNNKSVPIPLLVQKCLVKIDFGLILVPYILKQYLRRQFFGQYCIEKDDKKRNITIFHCAKNMNFTNFKNLSFVLKDIDYEFVLTYKDIFIEKDDEYISLLAFDSNYKPSHTPIWIFGENFLKKYQLVFDLDRKIMGLYKENNNDNNNNSSSKNDINENKKNYLNGYNIIYIVLIIILSLIVIALVVYIIYYIKKPRKYRTFELDDNFDYIPSK